MTAPLAAKPDDPDAMNDKRALEDTKLASNVREATIEECASIAKAHKGAAQRARKAKGKTLHLGVDGYDEIVAEERGEDIASEIIERSIRALSTTGKPKP